MPETTGRTYEAVFRVADAILRSRDEDLRRAGEMLGREDIAEAMQQAVEVALAMKTITRESVPIPEGTESELVRELEARYFTTMEMGTVLDDSAGHIPWLPDRKAEIDWRFWHRYSRFLEEERHLPINTLARLEQLTDQVLGRLEDPSREGPWDRRGVVVGQVQSGKTSNYIGLICKAADAGYRLIIVLAGLHNSLRCQTQLRLDEGFLGFDTQKNLRFDQRNARVGVGLIRGAAFPVAHALTSSTDAGDFRRGVVQAVNVSLGATDPILLVVKKNKTVLKNLLRWITSSERAYTDNATDQKRIGDVPLLVIDDEADNASINTKVVARDEDGRVLDDEDPSAINSHIRKVLAAFDKSSYVGYTATPFANIFINPEDRTTRHGEDLFPRSFIVNLQAPSDYVGPVQVFGLGPGEDPPLPVVRRIYDYEEWIPDSHKKDHEPGPVPSSLRQSVLAFILACAARIQRGQANAHNSMLIHATRFTRVQKAIAEQVGTLLYDVQRTIVYGPGGRPTSVLDELQELWQRDFVPTTHAMAPRVETSWDAVRPHLEAAATRIHIKEVNGRAKDVLDYWENPNGLSVIAIGGEKLSRGLTLEGLTVSYYLRASRMYDTLMQMGRWFGYRPGYLDLCRLYTSPELVDWYKHITVASEELRDEFEAMTAMNATPSEYGLKVRTHPKGLTITSVSKMRSGTVMRLSFAGSLSETVVFYCDDQKNGDNLANLERVIAALPDPERKNEAGNLIWRDVSSDRVLTLLEGWKNHPDSRASDPGLLTQYIEARNGQGELVDWTLVVIGSGQGQEAQIGRFKVPMTKRRDDADPQDRRYLLPKRHLLSPTDELLDLTADERELALEASDRKRIADGKDNDVGKPPSGPFIRKSRSATRGLFIVYVLDPSSIAGKGATQPVPGFVISFPDTDNAEAIEYKVNNVYYNQEFELE